MEIQNKKINFLGDSITQGVGVSAPEYMYVNVYKDMNQPAVVRNYGISGTRFAEQRVTDGNNVSYDQSFCSRVEKMDPDADVVVVFGGVNDYSHGDAPFGRFEDRTPYTFYGACHTLMRSLIEKYPLATIVFMTPLQTVSTPRNKTGSPTPLCEYVRAIRETAAYYSIPVLDLFATAGIQPHIPVQKELLMPDGIHPNDVGAKRIAERLTAFFKTL